MGWTPPKQNVFTPGEIPHKRQISDEEQANLEKYGPKIDEMADSLFGMPGGMPNQNSVQAPDIPDEIAKVIDEVLKNSNIKSVLDDDFDVKVEDHIIKNRLSVDLDDVIEAAYQRELTPPDFYFAFGQDDMMGMFVVITSVVLWDKEHRWDDRSIADFHIPTDLLYRLQESVYGLNDGVSASKARRKLIVSGFIENNDLLQGAQ